MHRLVDRLGTRGTGLLLTCALSGAAVCALVGPDVLQHPERAIVGYNPSSDFQIMTALHGLAWGKPQRAPRPNTIQP